MLTVLPDGTYLSVLINPAIRGARRRAAILAAADELAHGRDAELEPTEAHLVRVVEYDVPDGEGNGTGEVIVLLTTITEELVTGHQRGDFVALCGTRFHSASLVELGRGRCDGGAP